MFDVIVVGAGPTGMYAAYLSKLHNLKVMIVEASNVIGGQMNLFKDKPIYDLPGHIDIYGSTMIEAFDKQLELDSINIIKLNEEILSIKGHFDNFSLITKKNIYLTKTVVLATGGGLFRPILLGIENEEKFKNIFYKVENSKKFQGKRLVIFGGGDSAIDWAHFFHHKGSVISLVHRRETFRGQESLLNEIKNDIGIYTSCKLLRLEGKKEVKKVVLFDKKTKKVIEIETDYVLVFYGQKKNLIKDDRYQVKRNSEGFLVTTKMETSREGIFAIGNMANYEGKIKMLITGFGEAATAIGSVVELIKPGKKLSYYVKKKEN